MEEVIVEIDGGQVDGQWRIFKVVIQGSIMAAHAAELFGPLSVCGQVSRDGLFLVITAMADLVFHRG